MGREQDLRARAELLEETARTVPVGIEWKRCDLSSWGEVAHVNGNFYRKTWEYTERAKNVDGLMFSLTGPDGRTVEGETEDEQEIDVWITQRETDHG